MRSEIFLEKYTIQDYRALHSLVQLLYSLESIKSITVTPTQAPHFCLNTRSSYLPSVKHTYRPYSCTKWISNMPATPCNGECLVFHWSKPQRLEAD